MRYVMSRRDYEALMVLPPDAKDAPNGVVEDILAREYPKSSQEAVLELRARGLDASKPMLDYLIKKGDLPEPSGGGGRNRRWTREDIDRAAVLLEEQGTYVPEAHARVIFNLDAGQVERVRQQMQRKHPDIPLDQMVIEIFPGAPGVGLHAEFRLRPMTKAEQAEWKKRIARAKRQEQRL